jgi:hypothetical protein
MVLVEASGVAGVDPPQNRTMRQALGNATRFAAIARLLEFGALATEYVRVTPEMLGEEPSEKLLRYKTTRFGEAVLRFVADRMGIFSPELIPLLEEKAKKVKSAD